MNVMEFKFKKVFNIIGIIAGFIAIRYSAAIRKMSAGSYEYSERYGGDAYTGIQNAAAKAANNVNDLAELMRTGISYMLLIGGLIAVCYFMSELLGDLSVQKLADFIQNVSNGTTSGLPKMDGNNASSGTSNSASAIAGALKGRLLSGNKASTPEQAEPSPSQIKPEAAKPDDAPAAVEEVKSEETPAAAAEEVKSEETPAAAAEEVKPEETPAAAAEEVKSEEIPAVEAEEKESASSEIAEQVSEA